MGAFHVATRLHWHCFAAMGKGRGLVDVNVHPPSTGNFKKMRSTESHDYFAAGKKRKDTWWTEPIGWVVAVMVGITISTTAFWMHVSYAEIQKERIRELNEQLKDNKVGAAWAIQLSWMIGLVGVGVVLTLLVPAIGGSGLPAPISELNGSKVPNLLDLKTTVAKVVGATLAVASGLACGPEGPIIHIGGCVGSQVLRAARHFTGLLEMETDHCDFVSTGAGAGVAAAFKAPLAGTLFVVEEASSFFSVPHLWKTFIACTVAYFCSMAWNTTQKELDLANEKYEFEVTTGAGCNYKYYMLLYFVGLGVIGGLVGGLFNKVVSDLNTFRTKHINATPWKRVVEAFIIVLFHATIIVVLPKAFSCHKKTVGSLVNFDVDIKCIDDEILYQFVAGHKVVEQTRYSNGFKTEYQSKILFYTNSSVEETSSSYTSAVAASEETAETEEYTGANDFEYNKCNEYCKAINLDIDDLQSYTCEGEDEFNEVASLLVNYGGNAVKLLFKRGLQELFHAESLAVACIVYFIMAASVCGMCMPSGLVVPMLFIGGTMGRLYGLAIHHGWDVDMDPGYCAFIGAAAFMGGTGRILMFLAVVLLEVSNDLNVLPAVVIALVLAMWTGNLTGTHGLYHSLIDVQGLPYLSNVFLKPVKDEDKPETIEDIMFTNLEQFTESTTPGEAWETLAEKYDTNKDNQLDAHELSLNGAHRNYPIVDKNGQFAGMISIDDLRGTGSLSQNTTNKDKPLCECFGPNGDPIIRKSSVMAKKTWLLTYGYSVFERLGVRSMVVVDDASRTIGLVTRMTLMPWWEKEMTAGDYQYVGHDDHDHAHDDHGDDHGKGQACEMHAQPAATTSPSQKPLVADEPASAKANHVGQPI